MAEHTPPHILIIDDDERLRLLIGRFLREDGFRVTLAANAAEARQRLEGVRFDLMVVDVMMPGESGLDLVRDLKQGNTPPPCLMLTAMGDPGQRLHGLESGADDYMTKPFEPKELSFRIKNILSRLPQQPAAVPEGNPEATGVIPFGPHRFDRDRRLLTTGGKRQHLTAAERKLLGCFCDHHDNVLSREQISGMLDGQMEGRSIDVAVARLRRKLEPNPSKPVFLLTARGHGWVLETDHRDDR
ncbi:MAG: response regulator [Candidatus Puniceispirillales bacterium]